MREQEKKCFMFQNFKEMDFDFRPLWQMNDTEKATLAKTVAETVQIAVVS